MATYAAGMGLPSLPLFGFGTQFFDPDLDSEFYLFAANGHVLDNVDQIDQLWPAQSAPAQRRRMLYRYFHRRRLGQRPADLHSGEAPGLLRNDLAAECH